MFASQAKHSVHQDELGKAIEDAVYEQIMKVPASKLDLMVETIIANNRVRKAGEQARDINRQTKTRNWEKITSFIPCATIKTPEPKELFLVEGLSAGGGLRGARDARYQAILQFKGKNLNIWDCTIERAMQSEPWLNLVKVLGCGIGPTFDIKKLKYDKIIIAVDADCDAKHLKTQFFAFFIRFMPEIILEGKLYLSDPPLYGIKDSSKRITYVNSKSQYIERCVESISGIRIEFPER
jgi:DNA gyrase/topoisomerase IV subunit B